MLKQHPITTVFQVHKEPIKKINVPARYKSQALLDEQALAAAMAYVDLNPIRAGLAKTPEDSEYTSIKARRDALKREQLTSPSLHPFVGNPTNTIIKGIPLRLHDYLELVEWNGRQIHEGKPAILHPQYRHCLNACTSNSMNG